MGFHRDPETLNAERQRANAFNADPDRADMLNRLKTATPAQIDAYIDANVTNLAGVRAYLKKLTKGLALAVRD